MPQELKTYLMNFSSPQIYTTTLPEAHGASALAVLELAAAADSQRRRLAEMSAWLRSALSGEGFDVLGDAHILAVRIGNEQAAVQMARRLYARGLFLLPARYPTVPLGNAILRVSLTAMLRQTDLDLFLRELREAHVSCC